MFLAWKRARASNGAHTWVRELYGREPEIWTHNLSEITLELMIEEQRQDALAAARRDKSTKFVDPDVYLKMTPIYSAMRKYEVRL